MAPPGAAIDATTAPHVVPLPAPGVPPTMPTTEGQTAPHMTPNITFEMNPLTTPVIPEVGPIGQLGLPDMTSLESRQKKYDNVDSNAIPEAKAVLNRLNQCNILGVEDCR